MLDVQEKRLRAAEPAKVWRNWYRVYRTMQVARAGLWAPGFNHGPDTFPSKDIAEQHAIMCVAQLNPPGRIWVEHLGAFPDGASPRRPLAWEF